MTSMATPYFGPGGQAMTLGKDEDKWSDVVAEAAHIDSFKGKGSASMPVYMDANGVPQPVTSYAGKAATAGTADTSKTCSGNSATATKATQDSAGQQINTTYIKGLSVSGKTVTYTKGDGTTGTITTQDTVYTHPNSGATAGTYRSVTVNAQGHVTAGSNPTTLAGYGITDAPTKTGSGASGTWGINISGKANTAGTADTATKATQDSAGQQINSTYIKGLSVSGKTITYTKGNGSTGTITTQDTVYTHPNSGVSAGTYKSVTVNAQGHVTAGSNPTTLAGYGITDGALKYELGATDGSAVYSMFGSCAANVENGNISATILLTQGGNFGGSYQGAWLIQMSIRNAKSMSVKTLRTPSTDGPTFGYYVSGSTCYFGAQFPAYRGNANITVLSNAGFTLKDFGDVSAAPSGWTKVTPEIMIDSGNYTSYVPAAKVALCGEVKWYAGKSVPSGWLLCNGAAISRTTYSALYNVIGTTYGAGNGSTTFALPNLIDRVVQGAATAGTYKAAGLPDIYGTVDGYFGYSATVGAFYLTNWSETVHATTAGAGYHSFELNAKKYNPIYGASATVQPPALTMLPIIKY